MKSTSKWRRVFSEIAAQPDEFLMLSSSFSVHVLLGVPAPQRWVLDLLCIPFGHGSAPQPGLLLPLLLTEFPNTKATNQGEARLRVSWWAACMLMVSVAVLLTLLTCVTQGWGVFLWRKISVLSVQEDVPLFFLPQCNSCSLSPSATVKLQGKQQEQTFLSPNPVLCYSLRTGTCFSVGGDDAGVWDEQGK